MGSFFLRSHTTAFPLGLAEARMCWTCLFQDTTLMSSTGWEKQMSLLPPKQRTPICEYLAKTCKTQKLSTLTSFHSHHRYETTACETRKSHLREITVSVSCFDCPHQSFKLAFLWGGVLLSPNISLPSCTHLCFCTWSHWTAKVVQIPDINLRIIGSGCKEITLKLKYNDWLDLMSYIQENTLIHSRVEGRFTWKGLKSSARMGPVCLSDCPTTASAPELIMISGLYTVNMPFSLPPISLPPAPSAPIPKFTQTILCNLWIVKRTDCSLSFRVDTWLQKKKVCKSIFNEDIHPRYLKMSPFIVAYEQTFAMDVWNALEITCWVFLMSLLVAYLGRVLKSPSQISPVLLWCWRKHPAVVQQSPRPGT